MHHLCIGVADSLMYTLPPYFCLRATALTCDEQFFLNFLISSLSPTPMVLYPTFNLNSITTTELLTFLCTYKSKKCLKWKWTGCQTCQMLVCSYASSIDGRTGLVIAQILHLNLVCSNSGSGLFDWLSVSANFF